MIALRSAVSAAALSTALAAVPAAAQVTPQLVWDNWQTVFELGDQDVSIASVDATADRISVTGVSLSTMADDLILVVDIPSIEFISAPGGTVEIRTAPAYTISISDSFEDARVVFELRQPGMQLTASGSPDAVRYDFTLPAAEFEAIEFSFPEGTGGTPSAEIFGRVVNSTGHYLFASDGSLFSSSGTMESFDVTFDVVAPDDLGFLRGNVAIAGVTSTVEMANLHLLEDDPMMAMMMGLSIGMTIAVDRVDFAFDFEDGPDQAQMEYSSVGNTGEFLFNRDGLVYDLRNGTARLTALVPDFPLPLELGVDETAMRVAVPITLDGAPPRDYALLTRLVGLTVSDEIMSIFDPVRALPRTPTTFIVDVTGVGIVDVMMAMMGSDMPLVLESMSLNELRVVFGGAELTGSGAFTFDMNDLITFDGLPRPEGRLSLALAGGNALLDAIGQLGLFAPEEMMGIRMGIGMVGRPVGPDQVESVIEVTPDGALMVNGMRMQ